MKAQHLLIERQLFEDPVFKQSYRAGRMLVEAELTAQQIDQVFRAVADGAAKGMNNDTGAEGGASNRTMLGKGADMVTAVKKAFDGVKDAISKSGPIKGMDATFDTLQQQILMATEGGEEGKVSQALQRYRTFSNKYPIIKSGIKAGMVALAGLATAGLGGPAIVAGIALMDRLLMGDKLSSAAWNAFVTGGVAALVQWVSHHPTPGPHPPGPDVPPGPGPHPPGPGPGPDVPPGPTPGPTPVTPDIPSSVVAAKGDTLSQIAQAHQTSVKALMQANPQITNPNALLPGTQINLPPVNSTTYMGGVGTASDTAAKVASGQYSDVPSALAHQRAATAMRENKNTWIDRDMTIRRWALNESLGKPKSRTVWLTEAGIEKIFEQVAIRSYLLNEAAGERIEPTMDSSGAPAATTTPAAPAARGDRFNRPGAGTAAEAPPTTGAEAGNKPGLLSRMWGGVKKAASTGWDAATNKISYPTLGMEWRKINPNRGEKNADKMGAASEIVEKFLRQQGVKDALIRKVFDSMGIPVSVAADLDAEQPAVAGDATATTTAGDTTATTTASDAGAGGAGSTVSGDVNGTVFSQGSKGGAGGGAAGGGVDVGATAGGTTNTSKGKAGQGDGERSSATGSVLTQIARMRGAESADDLIDIADMALSVLFRANPAAYKEFLMRLRTSASRPPRKSQDILKPAAGGMPPAPGVAGEVPATTTSTTAAPTATATGTQGESRRVYGGKYIRESTVDKMHKEFQQHLLNLK